MPKYECEIKQIVWSIRRLYRAVYIDSAKISRQFGLTNSQSAVLRSLYNYGALSSAELSRKLYVTPSNITGVIDRLEKKELVTRTPTEHDRRVIMIRLTPGGEELSRSLPDPIEERLIASLDNLAPDKVRQLSDTMSQILSMMDTSASPEPPAALIQKEDASCP